MRARLGASGGGAKTEQKLDSTIRVLSHKEAKLKGAPAGWLAEGPCHGGRGSEEGAARRAEPRAEGHAAGWRMRALPGAPTVARTPTHPCPAAVTSQNFDQQEALLARDLAALIADGQYLKHYGGCRASLLCLYCCLPAAPLWVCCWRRAVPRALRCAPYWALGVERCLNPRKQGRSAGLAGWLPGWLAAGLAGCRAGWLAVHAHA